MDYQEIWSTEDVSQIDGTVTDSKVQRRAGGYEMMATNSKTGFDIIENPIALSM